MLSASANPSQSTFEWGRAIAEAVSRWLPTEAARVWSCEICGGQSGAGAGCLRVLQFALPIFIPPVAPQSPLSIIWCWYCRPVVAAVPGGLSLTPLIIIIIITNFECLTQSLWNLVSTGSSFSNLSSRRTVRCLRGAWACLTADNVWNWSSYNSQITGGVENTVLSTRRYFSQLIVSLKKAPDTTVLLALNSTPDSNCHWMASAVLALESDTPVSRARRLSDFLGLCLSLAPVSFNFSSVSTRRLCFVSCRESR
jgi:hypothetical protein